MSAVQTTIKHLLLSLSLLVFSAVGAQAATVTWTGGGTTNNWSEAANWSGNFVPRDVDSLVFNATSTKNSVIDTEFTVTSVSVNSGYTGTLTQNATLTTLGVFTLSSGTFQGTTANATLAGLTINSPAIFNAPSGILTFNGGSTVFTFNSGTFNHNNGTVVVAPGASNSYFRGQQRNFYNLSVMGNLLNWDSSINRVANDFTLAAVSGFGVDIYADGNVSLQPSPQGGRSGSIIFADNAARTATITASAIDVFVRINNPNITVTTGGVAGDTIVWNRRIYLQAGTLQQSAADYLFNGYSDYTDQSAYFNVTGGTFRGSTGKMHLNTSTTMTSGAFILGTGDFGEDQATCPSYPSQRHYFSQSGGTFTSGGGKVNLCELNQSGGTFTAPASELTIRSSASLTGGTFTHSNGTLIIGNGVNVAAAGKTFYNVKLQGTGNHDLSGTPMPTVDGTLDLTEGTMNSGGQIAVNGDVNYNANFRGGGKQLVFQDTATRIVNLPASIYLLPMLLDNPNITVTTSGASASAIYAGNTEVKRGTFRQGAAELFVGPDNVGGAYNFTVSGGTFVGSSAPFTFRAGGGLMLSGGAFQGGTGLFTGNFINTSGGTFSTGGNVEIGNYYQTGGIFNAPSGVITVVAEWSHPSAGTFNAGTGKVKFTGYNTYNCANTYSINVPTTEIFNDLEIANSFCNARYLSADDTLIVNGDLRLSYARMGGGRIRPLGTITIDATNDLNQSGSTVVEFITPNRSFVINNPSTTVGMLPIEMNAANSTLMSSGAGKINFRSMTLTNGTLNQPNAVWDFTTYPGYAQSGGVFNGSAAEVFVSNGVGNPVLSGGTFNSGTGRVTGNWRVTGGTANIAGDMNTSIFTLEGGTFNAPLGTMLFTGGNGNCYFYHTTSTGTFNPRTGTVEVQQGICGFDVNVSETFNNLKFNGNANVISGSDTLIVNGAMTFNAGGGANGGSIVANGDVFYTNGGGNGNTVVKFIDTAARTLNLNTSNASYNALATLVDNPKITLNFGTTSTANATFNAVTLQQGTINQGDGKLGVTNAFVQSGGTFDGGNFAGTNSNFSTNFQGDFTLSGGNFKAAPLTNFSGNYTHTAGGTFNYGTGTVVFGGPGGTVDVNATENFHHVRFQQPAVYYSKTIAADDTIIVNGNLSFQMGYVNGGTIEAKRDVSVVPNFSGGNSNLKFTGAVDQSFTNTGGITTNGTWTVNKPNTTPLVENNFAPSATTTLFISGAIGTSSYYAPFEILSGNVSYAAASDAYLASLNIASGTRYVNNYGGSLILGGDVANSGYIELNGGGAACPQPDSMIIRSSSATQRLWTGNGNILITDANVKDQAGTKNITVYSGTNSGNNGTNWTFVGTCLAPTAANVTIGGRITNANGRAIANVSVSMIIDGVTRYTRTNPFGNYRFADVPVGSTVIVTVGSKRFQFVDATRVITISEENNTIDFQAIPNFERKEVEP